MTTAFGLKRELVYPILIHRLYLGFDDIDILPALKREAFYSVLRKFRRRKRS